MQTRLPPPGPWPNRMPFHRWTMTFLARFFALPLREQATAIEAALCLGCARLLLLVPFRGLAPFLGTPQGGGDLATAALDAHGRTAALAIRRALLRVAARLPWRSSCLVCAIAGRMMLWRRRLPSSLYLGARTDSQAALAAHAWLRCGEIDVVGAEIADQYAPIVAFKA